MIWENYGRKDLGRGKRTEDAALKQTDWNPIAEIPCLRFPACAYVAEINSLRSLERSGKAQGWFWENSWVNALGEVSGNSERTLRKFLGALKVASVVSIAARLSNAK